MTRLQRLLVYLGAGGVVLLFVESILSIWVASQTPEKENATLFGNFIIPGFLQMLKDAWNWLDANDKPILVLLTLALLGVAAILAALSRELVVAARDRKAAQVIDAPFLIPELTAMEDEDFHGRRRPVAVYALRNTGRSPAIIRRMQHAMIVRDRLPDEYEEVWQGENLASRPAQYIAIGPTHQQPAQEIHFRCALMEEDVGRVGRRYLITRFEFEDLLGHSYIQGFSMQLPAQAKALQQVIVGDAVYNYRRERVKGAFA